MSLAYLRCPDCSDTATEKRVVDSRQDGKGGAIRRRRECGACKGRFTTFEELEESSDFKREGIIAELEGMLARLRATQ